MNTETNYADIFCSENQLDSDQLEKNVADFPASSVARLMLLYHHKKNNLPGFRELAKQTGIYLNNISWIQFQLNQIEKSEGLSSPVNEQITGNFSLENEPEKELSLDEKKEELISGFDNNFEEKKLPAEEILEEIPERSDDENKDETVQDYEESSPVNAHRNESFGQEQITGNNSLENEPEKELPSEENEEELISNFEEKTEEKELPAHEVLQEIPERLDDEKKDELPEPIFSDKEFGPVNDHLNESIGQEQITENSVSENPVEEKSVSDIKIPEEDPKKSESETPESAVFSEGNAETEISFEPLHTVDYFASQGIKITEEDLANDHLGKQVKSFTAWLKSMKKLHPGQLPEQNEVIEKIIQSSSESSNQDAHVLTEAMAEVLVKQDKKEKAIEMYQKLSLLNPSKSAYFAAKIESLKII
jgi:hypothetical protein